MPCDGLKYRLERQFLASEGSLDDEDVDVSQQVAALSADDCASTVTQLLTYFDTCVCQLKQRVSYVLCVYKKRYILLASSEEYLVSKQIFWIFSYSRYTLSYVSDIFIKIG